MVQVKRRTYSESLLQPPTYAFAGVPLTVASVVSPHGPSDTLLRTRFEFDMSVRVGTPDPPPELWWSEATALLYAFWNSNGSATCPSMIGNSEHFLGSTMLHPRMTQSATAPGEYVVQWATDEPLITETSRVNSAPSVNPRVVWGLHINDLNSALDGTYASVGIFWYWRYFSLWGSAT